MRFDAVIFDLFGALVDNFLSPGPNQDACAKSTDEVAMALGAPREGFAQLWHGTSSQRMLGAFATLEDYLMALCERLGVEPTPAQVVEASQLQMEFVQVQLMPRPESIETLTLLRTMGCCVGLISDCARETEIQWLKTPFAAMIDAPAFSCAVGTQKPDPRIFATA